MPAHVTVPPREPISSQLPTAACLQSGNLRLERGRCHLAWLGTGEEGDHCLHWDDPHGHPNHLRVAWGAVTFAGVQPTPWPLPTHLLAAAGSDVRGMHFLTQRLDDGHLGKVLHRLLELRQGTPAIAFATFDVLGLGFWGRIWEIQEQKHIGNVIFADPALGSSQRTRAGLAERFRAPNCHYHPPGQEPAPFQDHYPHRGIGPDGLESVLLQKEKKKREAGAKWNQGSIFLTLPQFPNQVCSDNKMGKNTLNLAKAALDGKSIRSLLLALIFITGDGQV